MGVKERRERERAATRQAILSAARRLSDENGWSSVTIRNVAAEVEYSPALIYEYFASKDAMLVELMRDGFGQLHAKLKAANSKRSTIESAVEAVGLAYWSFAISNPAAYQIMHGLDGVPFGTDKTPPEARACFDEMLVPVKALLVERGGAARDEIEDQVELYWAFLHGLVSLHMNNRVSGGTARASRLAKRLVREFVRGCVPDSATSEAAPAVDKKPVRKRSPARATNRT